MNAPSTATVRVQHRFDAPPERVFDAWLDPELARRFLFTTPNGQMVRAEVNPRVGGRYTFTDRRDGVDVDHVGEYEVIDRPRRLVFTFAVPRYSEVVTRVTLDLAPRDGGCVLTLTHEDVLPEYLDGTAEAWSKILGALAGVAREGPESGR